MPELSVVGGTLGAAAAAARLAKLGHTVTFVGTPDDVGGHWRTDLAPVLTLPALWRDLFRKSGRMLDAELARGGLELVVAPPAVHRFRDGTELVLPAERGSQFAALSAAYGTPVAERWRDLLDDLDDVWLAARAAGIEQPRPDRLGRDLEQRLWKPRTLADLANRVDEPHLAEIITSVGRRSGTDAATAPALLATRLVIERTFGRWRLTAHGRPAPATRLLDLLAGRLATRHVRFADEPVGEVLDFTPVVPAGRWLRPQRAALAPAVRGSGVGDEVVTHAADGPIVAFGDLTHDHTAAAPDAAWGFAPDSWRAWWARPAQLSAGNEPWAELANAALTVYATHLRLTGADVRPSNKAYKP